MSKSSNRFSAPLTGAYYGMIAWLAYGVIELICLAVLPRLVETGYEYKAYDIRFNAVALLFYAAIGAATGFIAGWVVSSWKFESGRLLRALHTAGLSALLLAVLWLTWGSWASPIVVALALVLVLAACAASIGSSALAAWARPFAAAWFPCACYLVAQWMGAWLRSRGVSSGRTSLYTLLLIAVFGIIAWIAPRLAAPRLLPVRALAGVVIAAVATCAVTATLRPVPYTTSETLRPAASGKPNVILIVLDTVRADHLSVYGYQRNTTPNLKAFAADSSVFTRAVSASDMSLPSHASMFTGLYASQHGAHFVADHRLGVPLDQHYVTLAEMLAAKGFWTAGVVSNGGYLSVSFGLQQGFRYWDQRLPAANLAPQPDQYLRGRLRNLAIRFMPTGELDRVSRSAGQINDAVTDALAQRPSDGRPFLLFINYMDAHVPYIPPAPYDTMFAGKDPGFTESRYMATYFDVVTHNRQISDRTRAHLVSQYDGAIAYLDSQLGALFARLKASGQYDNSLIIITSDHGEAHGERNCMDHGGMSLYEDQIHVPLLVKFPNGKQGAVVEQPVTGVDLVPTVLDVAGLPIPAGLPGLSLAKPLPSDRDVISESFPGGRAYFANGQRFDRTHRSVVTASLKYIAGSAGRPELYDIPRDPLEARNLYNFNDEPSKVFATRLRTWSASVAQQLRGPGQIDSNAMERLRSLGYVQ